MRYCVTLTMSSTVMSASFSMAVMRPGDFRLTGDIGRQFPRRIQTRRARGKQPACPGRRFDRIAVGADLTRNSDVVGLVGHGRRWAVREARTRIVRFSPDGERNVLAWL